MMKSYLFKLARLASLAALSAGAAAAAHGQTAVITGRVTAEGRPLGNVAVALTTTDLSSTLRPPIALAVTDEDGRYRLERVPAGKYLVTALAPAFVVENKALYGLSGETVTVGAQGAAEGVDLRLARGGVITGRVTDADGTPYVNGRIRLALVDERNNKRLVALPNRTMFETDDRGEYRIYGLPPGRYLVSAGGEFRSDSSTQTFHPAAVEESQAQLVEVAQGKEAAGVDIKVARPAQTYAAAGSVVDDRTGEPVAELAYRYSALDSAGRAGRANVGRTNQKGEFRITGLAPGRYTASVAPDGKHYSRPLAFEITDGDASDLQIRVLRAASIRGAVQVENSADPAVLRRLSQLKLIATVQSGEARGLNPSPAAVGPGGDFHIEGLPAGKARLSLGTVDAPVGFSILRVERGGVEQGDGLVLAGGEEVSGIRVVLSYGTGALRGQVRLPSGLPPADIRLMASIRRADAGGASPLRTTEVDAAGRFVFEGLATGTYTVNVLPLPTPGRPPAAPPRTTPQTVGVSDANITDVVVTLEPAGP